MEFGGQKMKYNDQYTEANHDYLESNFNTILQMRYEDEDNENIQNINIEPINQPVHTITPFVDNN